MFSHRLNLRLCLPVFFMLGVFAVGVSAVQPAHATELTGTWSSGSWRSCTTKHKGPLKATFCKLNDTQYEVEFRGRFFKILPFKYSVTLDVISDDGQTMQLAGKHYLGRRFGWFHYQATATQCHFTAYYSSCEDNGIFQLSR